MMGKSIPGFAETVAAPVSVSVCVVASHVTALAGVTQLGSALFGVVSAAAIRSALPVVPVMLAVGVPSLQREDRDASLHPPEDADPTTVTLLICDPPENL